MTDKKIKDFKGKKVQVFELFLSKNEHWAGEKFHTVMKMIAAQVGVRPITAKNWLMELPDYLSAHNRNLNRSIMENNLPMTEKQKTDDEILQESIENLRRLGKNQTSANDVLLKLKGAYPDKNDKEEESGISTEELFDGLFKSKSRAKG